MAAENPPVLDREVSSVWVLGETVPITDYFTLGEQLGQPGQFGRAVHAVPTEKENERRRAALKAREDDEKTADDEQSAMAVAAVDEAVAVKIISKARFVKRPAMLKVLKGEILVLRTLNHPHVIRFYGAFEDRQNLYIVMELASGGELFGRITERDHYEEVDAAKVFRELLTGLNYVHSLKIAHCDLKPDNFMFKAPGDDSQIKIIDFGMAKHVQTRKYFRKFAGTPYYVAPEVLKGKYTEACDMWSMGVVLFVLLFGYPPFYADNAVYGSYTEERIYDLIQRGFDPTVRPGYGSHFPESMECSEDARDLIRRLLDQDMSKRLTAQEALEHPWLLNPPARRVNPAVIRSLQSFQKTCKLKELVLQLMTTDLSEADVKLLRDSFAHIDANNDGVLTEDELRAAMQTLEMKEAAERVGQILKAADANGDGVLSYRELEMAFVHRKLALKEERLWSAFCTLDKNGDGRVTAQELKEVFKGNESKQYQSVIAEVDIDGDGTVDYNEFLQFWMNKESANTLEQIVKPKEGYLLKLGGLFKTQFQWRFFKVKGEAGQEKLMYWDKGMDSEDDSKAKGGLTIADATLCFFPEGYKGKKYTWGMTPKDRAKTYVIACANDSERWQWLEYLAWKGAIKPTDFNEQERARKDVLAGQDNQRSSLADLSAYESLDPVK